MVEPARCGARIRDVVDVVLVEDDSMVHDWVRLALESSEFRIVGEAASGAAALELAQRRAPQLLLLDYRLGDTVGTELLRSLRQVGITVPAVLMTATGAEGFNEAARDAGAQGSVLTTGQVGEFLGILRAVAAGQRAFDGRHPRRASGRAPLSPRERQVLRLMANGRTNREIAAELGIGGETVKTMVSRIFAKLGVRRRPEAVSAAHGLGLL